MKGKIISAVLSTAIASSTAAGVVITAEAAEKTPQYQTTARQMEELDRGLIAAYVTADNHAWFKNGVYLSWRLLGTENLENQKFDIYRDGKLIKTTGEHDATNYFDESGTKTSQYIVVKNGDSISNETAVTPTDNYTAKGSEVTNGNSHINSFTYVDIPIERPDPVARMGDGKTSYYYTVDKSHEGGANDGSIGDLDGDGEYELVLKWDPTDSKDSAGADYTGRVYLDGYELRPDNGGKMWRIDLGPNVTAGAHYTQFMVYDFDGDGCSEIICQTAPGSKDGENNYVSLVGDTEEIRNVDNEKSYVGTSGGSKGKNLGPEYYTVFDGETGRALATTAAIPLGTSGEWGDSKYNRAERFLAGVAYLDGVHPSFIACRGYYAKAVLRAYTWDGETFSMQWEHMGNKNDASTMYGQGNHNLSIADVDNDGKDEIVYGSATLDDDGKKVLGNTRLRHGDAIHTSDFNNDGIQETFSVKEDDFKKYAEDLRTPKDGNHFWESGKLVTSDDNGRGVMANIDDEYAKTHPNALALGWSSGLTMTHDFNGDDVAAKPANAGSGTFDNSLIYWDGDLSRELLDANIIQKYDAANGWTKRFYGPKDGYTLIDGTTNNYSKRNATLSADIWGDWREEVILPINKGDSTGQAYLRVYTSTLPTDYRLTTLMHDSQYRTNVAIQNVGYNQPPHQSYYIGSAALATDASGKTLNYLAPETPYTNVSYQIAKVPVTGITLSDSSIKVEKTKEASLTANIEPSDATKKAVTWTSSDPSVASVSGGTVKGIKTGKAVITATTKDGGYTASCEVEVWSNPVTGVNISESNMSVGTNYSKKLSASVEPADASVTGITWTSSNPAVASVDENGNVLGITTGAAVITATSAEGGFTASCVVNVVPLVAVDKTGDNSFETPTVDNKTQYSNVSASSANISQSNAPVGAETYKTFEKITDNHAYLSFHFTTGGQRDANNEWNWKDREYTLGIQLLGENDQNILTLEQPYGELVSKDDPGAKPLTSKAGSHDTANFATDWNAVIDSIGQVQGSTKRWIFEVDFDYDNNIATATITGTDNTWEAVNAKYTKEFELNGLSLEKLRYYTTLDGTGTITAKPQLSDLKYEKQEITYGETTFLYEKGTQSDKKWSSADIADWTQTNSSTTALAVDETAAENGRMSYSPTNPKTSYSASKTFETDKNGIVTYDVDWYFGSATGRTSNFEYIQFGSALRLGWTSGYLMFVSTDAGNTYDGITDGVADKEKAIFTGANTTYTKNVQVVFDAASNTIKSLKFDGKDIDAYAGYKLADGAAINSISFGFQRGGSANDWEYPCGLDRILVSQFVETDKPITTTAPSSTPEQTGKPDETAAPTTGPDTTDQPSGDYGIGDAAVADNTITTSVKLNADAESAVFIAASYDADGRLTALTAADVSDIKADEEKQVSAVFTEPLAEGVPVKLCLFDSIASQKPLCGAKGITVPAQSAQLSELFDTDAMVDVYDAIDEVESITE
ncbi:MAG: Ig-like domain-containing protein [bacterium]|nr:Ig-like domain-containing protein [bacterium]